MSKLSIPLVSVVHSTTTGRERKEEHTHPNIPGTIRPILPRTIESRIRLIQPIAQIHHMQTIPLMNAQLISNLIRNDICNVIGGLGDLVFAFVEPVVDEIRENGVVGDDATFWDFVLEDVVTETGCVELVGDVSCVSRRGRSMGHGQEDVRRGCHSSLGILGCSLRRDTASSR